MQRNAGLSEDGAEVVRLDLKKYGGALTFLDVLGWTGRWSYNPAAIRHLKALVGFAEHAKEEVCAEPIKRFPALAVHLTSFSDTIVFATSGGGPATNLTIHGQFCQKLVCMGLSLSLPLRGATGYGTFQRSEDWHILMGPVVDEMKEWYEAIRWSGVVMTPSGQLNWPGDGHELWVDYDQLPGREERIPFARCVDWATPWRDHWCSAVPDKERKLQEAFMRPGHAAPIRVAAICANTIEFYRRVCNRGNDS